jgi:hypothetical protein
MDNNKLVERKMTFPVRNESEAALLALDLIVAGMEAGVAVIPEVPEKQGEDCKELTVTFMLNEEEAALFDSLKAIVSQLDVLMQHEPANFTTH